MGRSIQWEAQDAYLYTTLFVWDWRYLAFLSLSSKCTHLVTDSNASEEKENASAERTLHRPHAFSLNDGPQWPSFTCFLRSRIERLLFIDTMSQPRLPAQWWGACRSKTGLLLEAGPRLPSYDKIYGNHWAMVPKVMKRGNFAHLQIPTSTEETLHPRYCPGYGICLRGSLAGSGGGLSSTLPTLDLNPLSSEPISQFNISIARSEPEHQRQTPHRWGVM